jgi:hypothetical protein
VSEMRVFLSFFNLSELIGGFIYEKSEERQDKIRKDKTDRGFYLYLVQIKEDRRTTYVGWVRSLHGVVWSRTSKIQGSEIQDLCNDVFERVRYI